MKLIAELNVTRTLLAWAKWRRTRSRRRGVSCSIFIFIRHTHTHTHTHKLWRRYALSSVLTAAFYGMLRPSTAVARRLRRSTAIEHVPTRGRSQKSSIARFQYSVLTDVVNCRRRRTHTVNGRSTLSMLDVWDRSIAVHRRRCRRRATAVDGRNVP